ncbi:MAG: outer membrane beta-barrel protein [Myxococcales bacterium]|nr:outer membrane beta-barrel protein [Myxococcales bacterium]
MSKLWTAAVALALTGMLATTAAGHSNETLGEIDAESGSGLSMFLEATEINSWINVNYTYNPRGSGNDQSINQNSNTGFHSNNDTFQLDQFWFQFDKPVTSESRAGFHADIAFGETARSEIGVTGNDVVTIYSAYISYLAPLAYQGIRLDAGELWTLLGAEVIPVSENLNITRGLVWGLQPVSHTGAILSTQVGPVSLSFGLVNAVVSDTAIDTDRNKALTGQVKFAADTWNIAASFIHGSRLGALENSGIAIDPSDPLCSGPTGQIPPCPTFPVNNDDNRSDLGIFDLVVAGNLGEDITLYVNFDYVWSHPANLPNASTYALAAAGRYQWNKDLGIAMRFEVVVVDPSNAQSEDEYSFTTTVDYALTDGLTARGEVRFDWGVGDKYRRAGDPYSFTGGADSQTLLLAELIYAF